MLTQSALAGSGFLVGVLEKRLYSVEMLADDLAEVSIITIFFFSITFAFIVIA